MKWVKIFSEFWPIINKHLRITLTFEIPKLFETNFHIEQFPHNDLWQADKIGWQWCQDWLSRWPIRSFANPLWFKHVRTHQFAKNLKFLTFLYSHQHVMHFCPLMLLFSFLLHLCYFVIWVTKSMNKPLPFSFKIYIQLWHLLQFFSPCFKYTSLNWRSRAYAYRKPPATSSCLYGRRMFCRVYQWKRKVSAQIYTSNYCSVADCQQ